MPSILNGMTAKSITFRPFFLRLPLTVLSLLATSVPSLWHPVEAQMGPPAATMAPGKAAPAVSTAPGKAATSNTDKAAEASDPLTVLNNNFRQIYHQAKLHHIEKTLPLIICYSDHMVLIDKDVREEAAFIPDLYTQLKVVDHVPLVLFALLSWHCDKPLDEETLKQLTLIRTLVKAAEPKIDALGLDKETNDRQHVLLDHSVGLIERLQRRPEISKAELDEFCRYLRPVIMENVDQAVAGQLESMDKTVTKWKAKLGPERFSKLTVVIVSGHMPRDRHSCFQYFAKALKVKEEGLKIVYSEGEAAEEPARDLVGTHVLDASIGEAFFKEPLRMHRDLLSDGAAKYLKAHPPLQRFSKESSN